MTAEEFWRDDPQLFVSYRTSFINKKKREMEELDYKCWYQGLYNHVGNNTLLGKLLQFIHNILSKKPSEEKIEAYPEKPFMQLEKDEKNKDEIKKQNYKKQNEAFICQASIKQIYMEKIKRQNEGK